MACEAKLLSLLMVYSSGLKKTSNLFPVCSTVICAFTKAMGSPQILPLGCSSFNAGNAGLEERAHPLFMRDDFVVYSTHHLFSYLLNAETVRRIDCRYSLPVVAHTAALAEAGNLLLEFSLRFHRAFEYFSRPLLLPQRRCRMGVSFEPASFFHHPPRQVARVIRQLRTSFVFSLRRQPAENSSQRGLSAGRFRSEIPVA